MIDGADPAASQSRAMRCFGLIFDWQTPDTLAGRRTNGIAQRGRDRRNTGFADAAERYAPIGGRNQMNSDIGRGLVHPRDAVLMKIILLHTPMLESNLAVHGEAQPHDHGTFELRADALGIDLRPAV